MRPGAVAAAYSGASGEYLVDEVTRNPHSSEEVPGRRETAKGRPDRGDDCRVRPYCGRARARDQGRAGPRGTSTIPLISPIRPTPRPRPRGARTSGTPPTNCASSSRTPRRRWARPSRSSRRSRCSTSAISSAKRPKRMRVSRPSSTASRPALYRGRRSRVTRKSNIYCRLPQCAARRRRVAMPLIYSMLTPPTRRFALNQGR